jgi:hypothetical protein
VAGKLVHFEIPARDSADARRFWTGLFGWEFQPPWGEMDYHMTEGGAVMGVGDVGHLVVYFDTDDIDASVGKIRELGGETPDKQPIPGVGWFSHCKDSQGNAFGLFQSDESAAG